jgi:hypothetical protein
MPKYVSVDAVSWDFNVVEVIFGGEEAEELCRVVRVVLCSVRELV